VVLSDSDHDEAEVLSDSNDSDAEDEKKTSPGKKADASDTTVLDDDEIVVLSDSDHDEAEVLSDSNNSEAEDEKKTSPGKKADASDTTVLMRNVPLRFTRKQLMDLLDREGFCCKYKFLYLPFNLGSGISLGFAFINLESDQTCQHFLDHFNGFSAWGVDDDQACCVEKTRVQQGLEANIERYRNSPIMHELVPDACKPVILEHGVRVDFPPPTAAMPLPPRRRRLLLGLAQCA